MSTASNAFRPFRDDHRRVLARLDALERVVSRPGRGGRLGSRAETVLHELVTVLFQQFASHMAAEEHVLYPALADAFPSARPSLEPLQREHAELRSMLLRLDELLRQLPGPARDEQVIVQAQDLVDLLRIHIRKEEQSVFNIASRVLSPEEIVQLGQRIAVYRGASPARPRRPDRKGSAS